MPSWTSWPHEREKVREAINIHQNPPQREFICKSPIALHVRAWHFNEPIEGPRGFRPREKCVAWAACSSRYVCLTNCKLSSYYSFFHVRQRLQYYLNVWYNINFLDLVRSCLTCLCYFTVGVLHPISKSHMEEIFLDKYSTLWTVEIAAGLWLCDVYTDLE